MEIQTWKINDLEYLEAPGSKLLIFHNDYAMGNQSGLELIHHDERVLTGGNLLLLKPNTFIPEIPKFLGRKVIKSEQKVVVQSEFTSINLAFTTEISCKQKSISIRLNLETPIPPEFEHNIFYKIDIFPASFFNYSYHIGDVRGIFSKESQRHGSSTGSALHQLFNSLGQGEKIIIAPEDPLRNIVIKGINCNLNLIDVRENYYSATYSITIPIPPNKTTNAIEFELSPNIISNWRKPPILGLSQVGYHPNQKKQLILELDSRCKTVEEVSLDFLHPKNGFSTVKTAKPSFWGKFMSHNYAIFDFSEIKSQGFYRISYQNQKSALFEISSEIYKHNIYQPTLHTFFPMQMCHMEVRDNNQIWHGKCHMDDAIQAPKNHTHFDNYRQYDTTDTDFVEFSHISALNKGGWHDAGDYDLAAGSQAQTVYYLSLAQEEFHPSYDRTSVNFKEQKVRMYEPNGIPDIVEQIIHGVENLLTGYRVSGHSYTGIIAGNMIQYSHIGDASTTTDNKIYAPELKENEIKGEYSGKNDDRWAFTNRDTNLEYHVITALAIASRVLKEYNLSLSEECLKFALQSWEYEQNHSPIHRKNVYTPEEGNTQEIQAAIEIYLTTKNQKFLDHIVQMWDKIQSNIEEVAWTISRVISDITNNKIKMEFEEKLNVYKQKLVKEFAENPYQIPFQFHIWGVGWQIQKWALTQYFLIKKYPQLFDKDNLLRVVNYMLGCHPRSNNSFVSGVGTNSTYPIYGMLRTYWTYIHGGVISGTALIKPDFLEFRDNYPFIFQQSEYVISGAASYIFCILAADTLFNND